MALRSAGWLLVVLSCVTADLDQDVAAQLPDPAKATTLQDPDLSQLEGFGDDMAAAHRQLMDDTDVFDIYSDTTSLSTFPDGTHPSDGDGVITHTDDAIDLSTYLNVNSPPTLEARPESTSLSAYPDVTNLSALETLPEFSNPSMLEADPEAVDTPSSAKTHADSNETSVGGSNHSDISAQDKNTLQPEELVSKLPDSKIRSAYPLWLRRGAGRKHSGRVLLLYPVSPQTARRIVMLYPRGSLSKTDKEDNTSGLEQTLSVDLSTNTKDEIVNEPSSHDETDPEPKENSMGSDEDPTEPYKTDSGPVSNKDNNESGKYIDEDVTTSHSHSNIVAKVTFDREPESAAEPVLVSAEKSIVRPQLEAVTPAEEYAPPKTSWGLRKSWSQPQSPPPQYSVWNHNGMPPRQYQQPWYTGAGTWGRQPGAPATAPWPQVDRSDSRTLYARTAHPAPWRGGGRPPAGAWPWPALYDRTGGAPAPAPSDGAFPLYASWRPTAGYERQYPGTGRFPLYSHWYRPAVATVPGWPAGVPLFHHTAQWPRPAVAMATSEATSPDAAGNDGDHWQWPAVSLAQRDDQLVVTGNGLNAGALARAGGDTGWPPVAIANAGSADNAGYARSSSGGFNLFFHDDSFWTEPLQSDGGGRGGAALLPENGNWISWGDARDTWGGRLLAFTAPAEEFAPPQALHAADNTDNGDDSSETTETPDAEVADVESASSTETAEDDEELLDLSAVAGWDGMLLLVGSWPEPEGSGAVPHEDDHINESDDSIMSYETGESDDNMGKVDND